jgi:hypothetical protein
MPVQVSDIYSAVCTVLLEDLPTGLSLGLVSPQDFLNYFFQVYTDWTQSTSLTKKITIIPSGFATSQYTVPDYAQDVQEVLYNDVYLHQTTGWSLDQLQRKWRTATGTPRSWHEDRLPVNTIEIIPIPNVDGHFVSVGGGGGFYGVISGVTTNTDFDINCPGGLYGTINGFSGPLYLEIATAMYGTISDLVCSLGNVLIIAGARSTKTSFKLTDYIEGVPDSLTFYLKYGVLAKIFDANGESKDTQKAIYCAARLREGILLAKAVSQEGLGDNVMEEEGAFVE